MIEILIIAIVAVLIAVGVIALLTGLLNTVLVAFGFATVSWWTVLLIIIILRIIKWLIS